MAERITSRTNPLMTHIRKLASSRSYRLDCGEYLGDGVKLLREAVCWKAALQCVVCTAGAELPELPGGVRLVEVPGDVMRSISPMEAPQGALFTALLPEQSHIRDFQDRFSIVQEDWEDMEYIEWLFQSPKGTGYQTLPAATSLQRNGKALLLAGGKIGSALGIMAGLEDEL